MKNSCRENALQIKFKDPWQTWENIIPIEQDAIDAVIHARDLVVASLPANRLVAIYIKDNYALGPIKKPSLTAEFFVGSALRSRTDPLQKP